MRRNMDLIRLILLNLEDEGTVDLSSFSEEQIGWHNFLLIDAGLARGPDYFRGDKPAAILTSLTWDGYDFLDAARNETTWKKTINKIKNSSGTVAFEVIKALLIAASKEKLGLP